jgi:hypothetical protein
MNGPSDASRTPRLWTAAFEGIVVGVTAYLLLLAIQRFQQPPFLPALIADAYAALTSDGGRARAVLRGALAYPLLIGSALVIPFTLLIKPWPVLVGLAGGICLSWSTRATKQATRIVLSLTALAAAVVAVVAPLAGLPAGVLLLVPGLAAMAFAAFVAMREPAAAKRPAAMFALIFAVSTIPTLSAWVLSCGGKGKVAPTVSPGVEALFDNKTSLDIPANRLEFLCDASTGIRVVTPGFPSARVGILAPGRPITSAILYGEASVQSVVHDGTLYTAAKGAINAVDLRTTNVRIGPRLVRSNLEYLHFDAESGLFAALESQGGFCHLARRDTLADAGNLPVAGPGACVPVGQGRLLISEFGWPGRRLTLRRTTNGRILRKQTFFDIGFLDVAVDTTTKRIYAPSSLLGIVYVLDLDTLEKRSWFRSRIGVRGVLVDPSGKRVFSFTYLDGQVLEHELPSGRIVRAWRLGGPLRSLTWDCDGRSLLAANCRGGYRIRL